MKTRLGIFIFSLILLPLAGLLLSGKEIDELPVGHPSTAGDIAAIFLATLILLVYVLSINQMIKRLTGNNPINLHRNYFLAMAVASALLGWLLTYLNLFTESWPTALGRPSMHLLFFTLLFALLAPAVLSTRALLGAFPGLLICLARGLPLPTIGSDTTAYFLVPIATSGLLAGAAWPEQLFWLLWVSPLLLLIALQLLWEESTIFSGLKSGDWGRVICAALAGIIVANLVVISYQVGGGNLPNSLIAQFGYAIFGMLCLQLGDVISENWRGKKGNHPSRQGKKFTVPVVGKPTNFKGN